MTDRHYLNGRGRGLKTPDDLRAACQVQGKHWVWTGCMVRNRPVATIAGARICGGRITAALLGREAERQPQQRWVMRCAVAGCLSPTCLMLVESQGAALRMASRAGKLRRGPATSQAISRARQQAGLCYPRELVQWAQESEQRDAEVAHAIGCSRSTVAVWRGRVATKHSRLAVGMFAQLVATPSQARRTHSPAKPKAKPKQKPSAAPARPAAAAHAKSLHAASAAGHDTHQPGT